MKTIQDFVDFLEEYKHCESPERRTPTEEALQEALSKRVMGGPDCI